MYPRKAILALSILCISLPLFAQDDAERAAIRSAIEMQRQVTEAQRTMIVTDNVALTATEAEQGAYLKLTYRF